MTITVSTPTPGFIHVHISDSWGGKHLTVELDAEVLADLRWIRKYKQQLTQEQQFRDSNPVAKELFDQYTTYINLAHK
jgi:hypothetical protein